MPYEPFCKPLGLQRCRQLETEIQEKLHDVHEKLLQAGVDKKESERDTRLKETFANLQRIFPGKVHPKEHGPYS